MKELIIKKGDKQITVANKEDVTNALSNKVSTDDPRLTDARTPTSHTHTKSQITDFPTSMTPTAHTHTKTDITTVTIPKNADLNDDAYWQVGIYTVGSTNGGTISNRPDYLTGNYAFELEVHGFGSTLLQILKTLTSNNNYERLFYRAKTGGGFSQWFRIANYDEIPLGHVITSGNIDTLTNDGVYGISKTNISAGNITGVFPPTNRTGGVRSFLLESRKYDNNSSIQFAYILSAAENYNRVFYRSRASGAWDTWREIMQISDIDSIKVETQAKVTQFTNKDRITLERLIERMNNPDSKALFLRPTDSSLPYYTFCENIKVGKTNSQGVLLYLDGAAIGTSASSVVLKKIDGTKIGYFNNRGTDPAGWGYSLSCEHLGVGIHYLYAEATFPEGSVRKSNILTVFVKDTNNILPHEFWTPEYYGDVPLATTIGDFRLNATTSNGYTYSNNYSSIGEYSIMQKVDNLQYLALMDNNLNTNKNYTMQVDIYTTVDVILYFIARNTSSGTNTIVKSLNISAGSNTSPSMSINSNEFVGGETQLQFRIVPSVSNGIVYSTNFRLHEQ